MLAVHKPVALTYVNVLSVAPFNVIPPPSAVTSVGVATEPSSMFLSSTEIVVELIVVVVPLTVRSPATTKSLFTVVVPPLAEPILTLVVEPAAPPVPMFNVFVAPLEVAAVAKFTVLATVPVLPMFSVVAAAPILNVVAAAPKLIEVGVSSRVKDELVDVS